MYMMCVVVFVLVFSLPIPQRPQSSPGIEKNSQPKKAFMQPNPLTFPFDVVCDTACDVT